ncbi:MAG: VWA domain-containing protein [Luteitalea sp.]|nr:VWA domain-containing protein [Luteitalea sp.]
MTRRTFRSVAVLAVLAGPVSSGTVAAQQEPDERFRFRSGVELINVTATVTDGDGRFVSGLRKEDFTVFEDDEAQTITHFSAERVPVSLGLVVDTSNSMAGEKIVAARRALARFLERLGPDDEVFISIFGDQVEELHDWSRDRASLREALRQLRPQGGTALYDGVSDAVEKAQSGRNRKKAVVVLSDGNDTTSHTSVGDLKTLIQQSEVLVYAIGIEGNGGSSFTLMGGGGGGQQFPPIGRPFPVPGGRPQWPPTRRPPTMPRGRVMRGDYGLNVRALREFADQTGGRTEIVSEFDDIDPAVASIADELSRQYLLAYAPPRSEKDGKWHTIRVEVDKRGHTVRARRGYLAAS